MISKIKIILAHVLFWICFLSLPVTLLLSYDFIFANEFLVRMIASISLFYLNYFILIPNFLIKKRILIYVLLSLISVFGMNYILLSLFPDGVHSKLQIFLENQEQIPKAKIFKFIHSAVFSLTFFLLGGVFRLVTDSYKKDSIRKDLENQKQKMELQFLRTQLNPHFLFNSLNSIYSLVKSKSNLAPEAVITLAELMRYVLYETSEDLVHLGKEIQYIKNYISLQRLRLSNPNDLNLEINGAANGLKIRPLLLIALIENAFKHGVNAKGEVEIDIKIFIEPSMVRLFVENKITSINKENINGIGQTNIKNQLNHLYKDKHTLKIIEEDNFYKVDLSMELNE